MGKHKKQSSDQPPSEDDQSDHNPNPGTNWGIMHVLKYHHWQYVKKKLPHRKHVGNKNETENPGDNTKSSQAEDLPPKPPQSADQASTSKHVKGKKRNPGPVLKDSVKYIIKAMKEEKSKLGKDERWKRKGKHRRSKTCPEQDRTKEMDPEASEHGATTKLLPSSKTDDEETIKVPDKPEPLMLEVKSEGNSENELILEDKGKQLLDKEVVGCQVRLTAKLLTEDVFASQAKEIMDALDIISMNKEFLWRVLQDPGSPLAQHFQKQQAASAKMALKRSESFPLPSSQDDRAKPVKLSRLKSHNDPGNSSRNHITISPFEPKDFANNNNIHQHKMVSENQQVMKRFKDLRHKIKHVVKESKQEERRITMDAVLDKIPKDKNVSNDFLKKETTKGVMYCKRDIISLPFKRNKTMQHLERCPSLKDSMDRYLQLYESSFQKEANQQTPERQISRKQGPSSMTNNSKRSLARIFSSPELRFYQQHTDQEPNDLLSPDREVNAEKSAVPAECLGSTSDGPSQLKQESGPKDDQDESNQSNISLSQDSAECAGSTSDSPSQIEHEPEPTKDEDEHNQSNVSLSQEVDLGAKPNSLHLEAIEDDYSATMQAEIDKAELLSKDLLLLSSDLPQALIVDVKDEASFNYVKDVLHLAGFSGNESSLERSWHSNEQPLDPSMVEQLQGCMLHDPNCPGNETKGCCSHLIMFDLINEVLLEIYEGTYSYSPMMLSRMSKIRLGTHVVEEVWMHISWYLSFRTGKKQELDYVLSRDLMKKDGWMNVQFDMECVGLELEELIFDALLKELVLDSPSCIC